MHITSCRQPITVAAFTLNRQAGTPAGVPQAKPIISHDVFLFTGHSPKRADIQMPDFSDEEEQLKFYASLKEDQRKVLNSEVIAKQERGEPEYFTSTLKDWWVRLHGPAKSNQSRSSVQSPRLVRSHTTSRSSTPSHRGEESTKMPDFSTEKEQVDFIFAQNPKVAGQISKIIRALQEEGKDKITARKIACEQEWKRQKAKADLPVAQIWLVELEINQAMTELTRKGVGIEAQFAAEMKIYQDSQGSKMASRLGVYKHIIDKYSDIIDKASTPNFLDRNARAHFDQTWPNELFPNQWNNILSFKANNKHGNHIKESNIEAAIVYLQTWQLTMVASELGYNVISSILNQLKDEPEYRKLNSEQKHLREMDRCATIIRALREERTNPWRRAGL